MEDIFITAYALNRESGAARRSKKNVAWSTTTCFAKLDRKKGEEEDSSLDWARALKRRVPR
jgi:hypothetical protein